MQKKLKTYYLPALIAIFAICIAAFGNLSFEKSEVKNVAQSAVNTTSEQKPVIKSFSFDSEEPNYFDQAVKPETVAPKASERNFTQPAMFFALVLKTLGLIDASNSKVVPYTGYFSSTLAIPVYILYRKLIL